MSTPYIALYPSDYLADTAHLGLSEHGVYWRMLLHYYQHGKPFPHDLEKINRVILASTPEEKRIVEYILGEYFRLTQDEDGVSRWHHARADKEISAADFRVMEKDRSRQMGSIGGKRSAEVRRAQHGTAQPIKPQRAEPPFEPHFENGFEAKFEGFSKQPEPEPEPEKKEDQKHTRFSAREYLLKKGVSQDEAQDWLRVRKEKKLTPTRAAIDAIEKEAIRGNIDLPTAIHHCCENAWAGFKVSWLEKLKTDQPLDLSIFKD